MTTRYSGIRVFRLLDAFVAGFCLVAMLAPARATIYKVNPLDPLARYKTIGAIPWTSLLPGDSVLIYANVQPTATGFIVPAVNTPYKEHVVLTRSGNTLAPITIQGVPGPNGEKALIDGRDATTAAQFLFSGVYNQTTLPGLALWMFYDTKHFGVPVSDNIIDGFRFTGQYRGSDTSPNHFTNASGKVLEIPWVTSAIALQCTARIAIRNTEIDECGNGIFIADSAPNKDFTGDHLRIMNCSNPPYPTTPAGTHDTHCIYSTCPGLHLVDCYFETRPGSQGADVKTRADSFTIEGCGFGPAAVGLNACECQGTLWNTLNDPRHGKSFLIGCDFHLHGAMTGAGSTAITFEHEYLMVQAALKADAVANRSTLLLDANPPVGTTLTLGADIHRVQAIAGTWPGPWTVMLDAPLGAMHSAGEYAKTDLRETCVDLTIDQCNVHAEFDSAIANSLIFVRAGARGPNANDPMNNNQSIHVTNTRLSVVPATPGKLGSQWCSTSTQGILSYGAGNSAYPRIPLDHKPNRAYISQVTGQSAFFVLATAP